MTNEVGNGHRNDEDDDDAGNELDETNKINSGGTLLTRPKTAAPSLRNSTRPRLQRTESSLAVIGTERTIVDKEDIRKKVQALASNTPSPKQKLDTIKSSKLKGLKFRVKSAVTRVGEHAGVEQQNIPVVGKELLLTKSLSSPNFNTQTNPSPVPLVKDIRSEKKSKSFVFSKNEPKKTGLFISTEPITLATRPSSSLSITRKLRQDRPKTTSSLASGNRNRQSLCKTPEEDKKTSPCDAADNVEKDDVVKENKGVIYCTNQPDLEDQTLGLKTSDLRLALNLDGALLDQDRDRDTFSQRTDHISSPHSRRNHTDDDTRETENIYESIKSILRSRRENKSTARTARSTASSTLNPVLPLERELPPVRSPSALSNVQTTSINQNRSPSVLSQNKDTRLHDDIGLQSTSDLHYEHNGVECLVGEPNEEKCESTICNDQDNNILSEASVKTYKMATVEMYEKDNVRHPRLSIADEIKKQNARLEEKNSEFRQRENTVLQPKQNDITGKDGERDNSPGKGNVCGSPGFKYFQEQLKTMSNQPNCMGAKRLGSGPRTLHDASRKGSGDASKKSQNEKNGLDYKALGIRPLSDYTSKSPLDNLFVAGGSCTYKNGEQAVSKAAENIATPVGVLSKVSLQQDSSKPEVSDNGAYNENGVKVRVSLTYLKEKQGINPLGYRFRLDDCLSNGQQQHEKKIKSANSSEKEKNDNGDKINKRVRKSAPILLGHRVDYDGGDSDDDSSSQASSSSTPTAAFSGSELLYPNNDGNGAVHRSHGEELGASDMPGYERDRQKLRDLEVGNRRPASRNKKMSVVDKVNFDRERDDLRTLNNSLPSKAPALRNGGPRSSLVRGEQLITGRNGAISNTNRESDDLIAMGTIWNPANNNSNNTNNNNSPNTSGGGSSTGPTTRSSSNTTTSNKSIPINSSTIIGSNGFSQRKPASVSISNPGRVTTHNASGMGNIGGRSQKDGKEVEPKYSDPLAGAPASFQQRLMDLASLEAETIRWERTKRVKKKPKQDRDS